MAIQKAPVPTVTDEDEDQDQRVNNVTTEKVITSIPENSIQSSTDKSTGKGKSPKGQKKETTTAANKATANKTTNKTIYFEPTQLKKLRDLRRGLEEMYDQDINVQDIVRYLVEKADMRVFAQFGDYLDRKAEQAE